MRTRTEQIKSTSRTHKLIPYFFNVIFNIILLPTLDLLSGLFTSDPSMNTIEHLINSISFLYDFMIAHKTTFTKFGKF
jgi:hypothetical protein